MAGCTRKRDVSDNALNTGSAEKCRLEQYFEVNKIKINKNILQRFRV